MPHKIGGAPNREHLSFVVLMTQLADVIAISCVSLLLHFTIPLVDASLREYVYLTVVAVLLTGIVFTQLGLYREYPVPLGATLPGWLLVFLLLTLFLFITKTSDHFSRLWYGLWMVVGFLAIEAGRFGLRRLLRSLRRAGISRRRVVVIGCSDVGAVALARLSNIDETGFEVVAYFSDDEDASGIAGWKGRASEACDFVEQNGVDQLWLAFPFNQADKLEAVLDDFVHSVVDIRLVPDLYGFRLLNHSTSVVNGLPVVNLSMSPMDGLNRFVKAVEDKVFALIILLGISPWLLLIAIGVKLSSRGPVFYRQERMSWNGTCFYMYKFRSMPVDAETVTGAVWAKPDDDRTTRFGRFLRRTSLDELPQFFNVLKGDMSIVGPRPERPVFVEKFKNEVPGYMQKHKVKAGITGWAQVNGWRGDTDLMARIEHDLYYIEHWSLLFDLKIILLTLVRGLAHKNAY
ncbi:MAG TPA: undecaprenyl-phosphate glucose phosphotransferase [Spongiibacteraceae bacterium]|nr:undecaprenyl-phosphate glucose phosphotransferase [Spongiibacteraceae bacterium]HCS26529.1 undecaprenyl-phosphate glucose phosphotransferase [Spongiibacteraceae bacterium]